MKTKHNRFYKKFQANTSEQIDRRNELLEISTTSIKAILVLNSALLIGIINAADKIFINFNMKVSLGILAFTIICLLLTILLSYWARRSDYYADFPDQFMCNDDSTIEKRRKLGKIFEISAVSLASSSAVLTIIAITFLLISFYY